MSAVDEFRAWYETEKARADMNRIALRSRWSAELCKDEAVKMANWLETHKAKKLWLRFWVRWMTRAVERIQSRLSEASAFNGGKEAAYYKGHRRHEGGGEMERLSYDDAE